MASMAPVTVLHMLVKGCHPGIGMWACKQDQLPTCSLLKVIVSGTCSANFRSSNLNLFGKLYWNLLLNTGMGMTPSSKPAMHATHGGPSTIDFVLGATSVEKTFHAAHACNVVVLVQRLHAWMQQTRGWIHGLPINQCCMTCWCQLDLATSCV